MNIELKEIIEEIQNQFPREFTICLQAIQIRKLQEQLPKESESQD